MELWPIDPRTRGRKEKEARKKSMAKWHSMKGKGFLSTGSKLAFFRSFRDEGTGTGKRSNLFVGTGLELSGPSDP